MTLNADPADAPPTGLGTLVEGDDRRAVDARSGERLRLLESVVLSANDAVLITEAGPLDEPGPRIVYTNDAFSRMSGYAPGEVWGKTPRLLQGPKTDRATLARLRAALERWESTVVQLINYHKDGSEFWVELSVVPVADETGWYTHWVSIQRDITEHKRTEQELARLLALEQEARAAAELAHRRGAMLAEARAMHEAAAVNLADGLVICDASGRVVFWNARLEALFDITSGEAAGCPTPEILGMMAARSVDPEATRRKLEDACYAAEGGDVATFDYSLAGDPPRHLEMRVFPIVGPAGPLGQGGLVRDVTRERAVDRLKDELVAVVSHELRTPLSSLVGFAELLLTREYPEAQQQEFLAVMVDEGRRLTELFNEFLDLQRMESGRHRMTLEPTHIGPLLERAVNLAGEDVDRPIHTDVPESLPLVCADADRVQQVVDNLLTNARKYSPAGGRVELTARVVDRSIEVAIQDHGLGLPPSMLEHVFESFYRVDSAPHRAITGTGLGLSISRRIVEAHGGQIRASSDGSGQGARFSFTLPLAEPLATAPSTPPPR